MPAATYRRHREQQKLVDIEQEINELASATLSVTLGANPAKDKDEAVPSVEKPESLKPRRRSRRGAIAENRDEAGLAKEKRADPGSMKTRHNRPERTKPHPLEKSREEWQILDRTISQRISAFVPPVTVEFTTKPSLSVPYQSQVTLHAPSNSGPFALNRRHAASDALFACEAWFILALKSLESIHCHDDITFVQEIDVSRSRVIGLLNRIDSIKRVEWDRQREIIQHQNNITDDPTKPLQIDTTPYFIQRQKLDGFEPIALLCGFIVTVLNILCHLSRDHSNFVLTALRSLVDMVIRLCVPDNEYLRMTIQNSLPKDVRRIAGLFDLDAKLITYICCPVCCALYPPDAVGQPTSCPEECTYQDVEEGPKCGANLFRTRIIMGRTYKRPIRTFLYQDFPTWFARFVSRADIEALLEIPPRSSIDPPTVYKDIWDAPVARNFKGRDGEYFFRYVGSELRVLFGASYDNFNPFHNRAAGKNVSVGAIMAICYGLPDGIRLRQENVYVVGIVNGPGTPSLTQTNHYMKPFIDHLERLWQTGYYLNKTHLYPEGRLARGAFNIWVMDLKALRQINATGSHNARYFCTFCLLLNRDMNKVDPSLWPAGRTCDEHRQLADEWLKAGTQAEREALFKKHSVRWAELLRLEYYQPGFHEAIDPMHAFQNVFRNLIRGVWQVDHESLSGDGLFVGRRPKSRTKRVLTALDLVEAYQTVRSGQESELRKIPKVILFRMCESRELFRAHTCHQMISTLQEHYSEFPTHWEDDIAEAHKLGDAVLENPADNTTVFHEIRARLVAFAEQDESVNFVNDALTLVSWLKARKRKDLVRVCQLLAVTFNENDSSETLARGIVERVTIEPDSAISSIPSSLRPTGKAVIGADMIKEINEDYARTVLPSWISAGPRSFDLSTHGKPSAYELRTTALVRLAISLPRLWGPRGGRHLKMLENFMHLLNAITILGTRTVIPTSDNPGAPESTAQQFREEYKAYLSGRVELYPTGKIQPTEHILYHQGDKLDFIGPIHVANTNVFERYNGLLQKTKTNMRFGELESTFMTQFTRAANLRAVMVDALVPETLKGIREVFESTFSIMGRSMLLRDIMAQGGSRYSAPTLDELSKKRKKPLDAEIRHLLLEQLHREFVGEGSFAFSDDDEEDTIPLPPNAWALRKCKHNGIWYVKAIPNPPTEGQDGPTTPHRDSHIVFKTNNGFVPSLITHIFAYEHLIPGGSKPILDVYLVVREYYELTAAHIVADHWRQFPISGGKLYYDRLKNQARLINVKNVAGHFAKTPYGAGEISGIDVPCLHALPLTWHHAFGDPAPVEDIDIDIVE
ncbi:hypothetical protein M422DRAFT_27339 [Sphaerobolus stellatus SS14]|nr:hypothetical protein M422DRAFT_27339 [Sphaerobolus stellatus SS14]